MRNLDGTAESLQSIPDRQMSLTDPDARSMISQAKGTGVVGYNVQVAVDAKHHLIVAHEVTNIGSDRSQLSKMAQAARDAMGRKKIKVMADRGYFNAPEIKLCADADIEAFVPKTATSSAKAHGRFDRADFIYMARSDEYLCPAGQRAIYRFSSIERGGLNLRAYWSSACPNCSIKAQCTPSDYRRIRRWEHDVVLEAMQRRLDRQPDAMTLRRRTVEHVFGTLKHWMGSTHFLTRRIGNVSTEMSLQVLAYNLKRVIKILGFSKMMRAMKLVGA
ncbi:IS1182 family transposase ISBusp4 [Cupriavidus numazuensis]|uniref:IS1182 family transposase ISBusp4 n=1 Tax=Cupriavidus numazuensis TaxID=221992 RepID=A0ABM8TU45_9BURK|nr:IS1182 family transposase ISBusp4 [Cupriavidus numazuensis]